MLRDLWPAAGVVLGEQLARLPVPHGYSSAATPDPARPKNLYIREDHILPHLPTLHVHLTGARPATGAQETAHPARVEVSHPVTEEDVIG